MNRLSWICAPPVQPEVLIVNSAGALCCAEAGTARSVAESRTAAPKLLSRIIRSKSIVQAMTAGTSPRDVGILRPCISPSPKGRASRRRTLSGRPAPVNGGSNAPSNARSRQERLPKDGNGEDHKEDPGNRVDGPDRRTRQAPAGEADGAGQDEPPGGRTEADAGDQDRGPPGGRHALRKTQAGEDGGEEQDGHGVDEREAEGAREGAERAGEDRKCDG